MLSSTPSSPASSPLHTTPQHIGRMSSRWTRSKHSEADPKAKENEKETNTTRPSRGLSLEKLTGIGRKPRVKKLSISKPLPLADLQTFPRTTYLELGLPSPTFSSSDSPSSPSTIHLPNTPRTPDCVFVRGHSQSSPGPYYPSRIQFLSNTSTSEPATPVTPFVVLPTIPLYVEPELLQLHGRQLSKEILKMEPTRLQPPPNTGTKIRAIQQAKEMELLVAERAKRSGDEPPPYDFFELIGKGSYGRVFKGYAGCFELQNCVLISAQQRSQDQWIGRHQDHRHRQG